MYTLIRSIAMPGGGSAFTQIEGVYHTREEAEEMIPVLQRIVENPNNFKMSYKVFADGEQNYN